MKTTKTTSQTSATVISAVALTKDEIAQSLKIATAIAGHDVTLSEKVDASVLGGIRIEVGDVVVDTTLKKQLETIHRELVK